MSNSKKKVMKKIKNPIYTWLLALVALLCIPSCSDKFESIEGQLNADDLDYSNTENMIQALAGAYQVFATRGWEEPLLLGVRGDDVNAGGLGDQPQFGETDLYIYTQDFWMFGALWNGHYGDIVKLNTALGLLDQYKSFADASGQALADQYKAEIMVLRAWLHFNLARTWGEVFIIQTTQPDAEIVDGPASKEEMMQFISAQMDAAIPLLPDMRPNERTDVPGGVTRYTAYAMKALAHLELEDYQGVADATAAIINSNKFTLYPDFYSLFKKPGELSDESLLEMQYSDFDTPTGDIFYHLYAPYGPLSWTPARANAAAGWGFYEPSMKFIKFMLDRGETVRLETSVLWTDDGIAALQADPDYATLPAFVSSTTRDGDIINNNVRSIFSSGKHYLPSVQITAGRNDYAGGKNHIVIRYAEILLMYAEALTRGASGSGMSADQAVNLVRDRADMDPLTGVDSQAVMDEKFAELAMEWGIRFYDMIRLDNFDALSYDGRTFTADKQLLPYPQAQLDALPTLPGGGE